MDLASTLTLTRRSFAAGMAALACAAGLSFAARADQQAEPASDAKDASSALTDDKAADAPAFPITIEHAFGETVVEQEPERVVCLAWSNMEAPLALGIAPVGYSAPNYGLVDENGTWPWAPRPPCSSTTPTPSSPRSARSTASATTSRAPW